MFERLQKLHISVSHSTLGRALTAIGSSFDEEVHKWRKLLLTLLQNSAVRKKEKKDV